MSDPITPPAEAAVPSVIRRVAGIEYRATVCAGCALLCDDVHIRESDGRITGATLDDGRPLPCPPGEAWFLGRRLSRDQPEARLGSSAARWGDALNHAATLLAEAAAPAVVGLTSLSVESVQVVAELAELLRGVLVPWPGEVTAGWGHASPDRGRSWGGLRGCSAVLFWGCDPGRTHPRYLERWRLSPERVHVLSEPADVPDVAALQRIRLAVRAKARPDRLADWEVLARLTSGHDVHVFVPPVLAADAAWVGQFGLLAAELLPGDRVTWGVLPANATVRTAAEVLRWTTGFAGPTDFADGSPRPVGSAWRAAWDVGGTPSDVVLLVGAGAEAVPAAAWSRARVIALTDSPPPEELGAALWLPMQGLDPRWESHVIRADGMVIRLAGERPEDVPHDPEDWHIGDRDQDLFLLKELLHKVGAAVRSQAWGRAFAGPGGGTNSARTALPTGGIHAGT